MFCPKDGKVCCDDLCRGSLQCFFIDEPMWDTCIHCHKPKPHDEPCECPDAEEEYWDDSDSEDDYYNSGVSQ